MSGTKRTLRERDENGKAKKPRKEEKPPLMQRFVDTIEDTAGEAWEAILDKLDRSPDIPFTKDKEKRHAFTNFVINIFDQLFDVLNDDDSECECTDSTDSGSDPEESSMTEESDESLPSDALESDDPSSFDGESDEDDPDADVSIASDEEEIAVSNDE